MKTGLNSAPPKAKPVKKEEPINHDSHAEERAVRAELSGVHARPKTLLTTAYRGRK